MNKFKVGDRVKVVSNDHRPRHHLSIGTVAEVLNVCELTKTLDCRGKMTNGHECSQYISMVDVVPADGLQKIVVTTDGKTTTAKLFSGKQLVKSAEAKCSPADEFDFKIGAGIAVGRLLNTEEKAEPEKLFPLEEIKAGYLLKIRDDDGCEYFMTVLPNEGDKLGCCSNRIRSAWWDLTKFGDELRYVDSTVIAVYGRAYNDDLLKNGPESRTLLWSRK